MPIYEFECEKCSFRFEQFVPRPEPPSNSICPRCYGLAPWVPSPFIPKPEGLSREPEPAEKPSLVKEEPFTGEEDREVVDI